jgi:hypothetical protein
VADRAFRAGTAGVVGLAAVALALAVLAPLATTAVALMAFGVLHNVLELRYIGGRFPSVTAGPLLRLLLVLISGIVLVRVLGAGFGLALAVPAEIVLTYAVLAAAAVSGLLRRPSLLAAVLAGLTVGLFASLAWPAYHVVVITHLHNVIPLVFLWEFAQAWPVGRRRGFLAVQFGWLIVVPALILAGVFDRWLSGSATAAHLFHAPTSVVASGVLPPGASSDIVGARLLTVFAFMQLLHFLIWIWYLPRYAPAVTAEFERRLPELTPRRTWSIGSGLAALLAGLFVLDYAEGRAVYTTLASYHAFLELPVLIAVLAGGWSWCSRPAAPV